MITKIKKFKKLIIEQWELKLPVEEKIGSAYYNGYAIRFFGYPGVMIVDDIDKFHGMHGNIYDQSKIDDLVELIEYSEDKVDIECSYGIVSRITLQEVKEHLQAHYADRFHTDYDGHEKPYSTYDEELDEYLGKDVDELEFVDDVMDLEFEEFVKNNRFIILKGKEHLDECIADYKAKIKDELDEEIIPEDEYETILEGIDKFYEFEMKVKKAKDEDWGDIGEISIQLRDAHHRYQAAKKVGESYFCINVSEKDAKEFKDDLTFVTNIYTKEDAEVDVETNDEWED